MDTQLNQLWYESKKNNVIVYPHNGETVIYYKQSTEESNTPVVIEIRINQENGKKTQRILSKDEMSIDAFDQTKEILDEDTIQWFRNEKNQTYLNICFDALEETDLACVPSPETEMIEKLDKQEHDEAESKNPIRRTLENGISILREILNEKQIGFFIEHHQNKLSARKIAEKHGVAHTTVSRALKVIDKKIEKYLLTH